jgi:hypothetical protein
MDCTTTDLRESPGERIRRMQNVRSWETKREGNDDAKTLFGALRGRFRCHGDGEQPMVMSVSVKWLRSYKLKSAQMLTAIPRAISPQAHTTPFVRYRQGGVIGKPIVPERLKSLHCPMWTTIESGALVTTTDDREEKILFSRCQRFLQLR